MRSIPTTRSKTNTGTWSSVTFSRPMPLFAGLARCDWRLCVPIFRRHRRIRCLPKLGLDGALFAFGSLALTESSPPQSFNEILTLAEVKSYLRLPDRSPADQAEDDELTGLIVAAREQAEILQGRDLIRKQFDLSLDYWNNYRIELRDPLASVDLFQYKDSTGAVTVMVEDSDFIVDSSRHPGFISPPYNKTWPTFAT